MYVHTTTKAGQTLHLVWHPYKAWGKNIKTAGYNDSCTVLIFKKCKLPKRLFLIKTKKYKSINIFIFQGQERQS